MRPRQVGGRVIAVCGLLLLLISGAAAAEAAFTDSPIVIAKVAADAGGLTVTLLNTAPFPVAVGGYTIAAGDETATLPAGTILRAFARAQVPLVRPDGADAFTMALGTPAGETVQLLQDPAHVWVAGDVFSLHGVDRYRYIVVYTRDTADGPVHGCYEVGQDASGRFVVSQYVHGQEVFGDAFIAEQGGRFLQNVPLDTVVITDDTPMDGGKTYFGLTLGSIFGAANAPSPATTPEPTPTAPHWPSLGPNAAPAGVVSVTRTPGPDPTVPLDALPLPMPIVTGSPAAPEPTVTGTPGSAPGYDPGNLAPTLSPATEPTPAPVVTSMPSRAWGRRFASWQAPSLTGRRVVASVTPEATVNPVTRTARTAGTFGRVYPPWYRVPRATA